MKFFLISLVTLFQPAHAAELVGSFACQEGAKKNLVFNILDQGTTFFGTPWIQLDAPLVTKGGVEATQREEHTLYFEEEDQAYFKNNDQWLIGPERFVKTASVFLGSDGQPWTMGVSVERVDFGVAETVQEINCSVEPIVVSTANSKAVTGGADQVGLAPLPKAH